MGSMVGAMQPSLREFGNQMNQYAFNQQLGRGVSNQMYVPPRSDYDPYTASRRPNYMPYGPNQQFYQPIYQPSYSQFSPMGYGQAPFGGFYQPPMMGFGQRFGQRFGQPRFQQPQQQFDPNQAMHHGMFSRYNDPMPPEMFGPATDISNQGQAALRQMLQPMLSPQPMQSQYRPIPYMTQSQLDAQQRAAQSAALAAAVTPAYDYGGGSGDAGGGDAGGIGMGAGSTGEGVFKKGGGVEEGIDSLLKK